MMKTRILAAFLAVIAISASSQAQQAGRKQDGFYSGQANGQSNGQASERVDGRGNRNEGVPPSAADTSKRTAPVDRGGAAIDAETMDSVTRPGLQR